jgi:hypothetical protein
MVVTSSFTYGTCIAFSIFDSVALKLSSSLQLCIIIVGYRFC